MVSGISSVSCALQANFLNSSNSISDFSKILSQTETVCEQDKLHDNEKQTLEGIAESFKDNWLEKFSFENEDDDENNSVSFDTSFDAMTGNTNEILSNQRNSEEQNIKINADSQNNKLLDAKTWEDLVSDEILQISIENNANSNLKIQIAQKQANNAYNLIN